MLLTVHKATTNTLGTIPLTATFSISSQHLVYPWNASFMPMDTVLAWVQGATTCPHYCYQVKGSTNCPHWKYSMSFLVGCQVVLSRISWTATMSYPFPSLQLRLTLPFYKVICPIFHALTFCLVKQTLLNIRSKLFPDVREGTSRRTLRIIYQILRKRTWELGGSLTMQVGSTNMLPSPLTSLLRGEHNT